MIFPCFKNSLAYYSTGVVVNSKVVRLAPDLADVGRRMLMPLTRVKVFLKVSLIFFLIVPSASFQVCRKKKRAFNPLPSLSTAQRLFLGGKKNL
jgi:hypothetical protein